MANAKFQIKGVSESPARIKVKARHFYMIVDEPQNLGGDDRGPNPVEYVLAALAGCLNVVGFLVAKEMGFEIRSFEVDIGGELNPAKFMGKSDESRAGYESIKATMKVDTDADEETLKEWVRVVEERCPVSDNLANATPLSIDYRSRSLSYERT